jgi:S1-C subfamily serine protease
MQAKALLCLLLAVGPASQAGAQKKSKIDLQESVVRVLATQRFPSYIRPWVKQPAIESSGSGVVIEGKRVLTNAHVVMHATQVYVQPFESSDKLEATIEKISPEFDLALLKLEDKKFFDKRPPLPLAKKLPGVRDAVTAYGFQSGGVGLSTTKGIVSRIEYGPYHYGQAGLRLEITAPLKEGNSGGPAISDGKIVGVVFAVSRRGNIGHAIPVEEVEAFLKAPKGAKDFEKLSLGRSFNSLENKALREKLRVPAATKGVLAGVRYSRDANGPLKAGDIVTKIGDYDIDNTGMVRIYGTRLAFYYLVNKLAKKGKVPLTIVRGGKSHVIQAPVRTRSPGALLPALKMEEPAYFVWGPLAFSPATSELVTTVQPYLTSTWIVNRSPLVARSSDYVAFSGEQLVMLISMFPHKTVKGYSSPFGQTVAKVNGTKIKSLRHLVETLRDVKSPFVEFEFAERYSEKLVFKRKEVQGAMEQILTDNGIRLQASPKSLLKVWENKEK